MSLGIRGANPIWSEVDLQGQLFDDTFYLFVLQNVIPYAPLIVYHDPDLTVPWTNPIRFLANGTLPIDIYYEENTVYRLEFRQGPTQQDPLIYEVDNYVVGSSGSIPIDTVAFTSDNQITNPQFSLINLQNPVTITGTDPADIDIAPGWTLSLAGTGSVTITQAALNNSNINPSNAPYALRFTMNGWTDGSVILKQRFFQNGMLWADKIVSTAVTAFVNGSPQSITANLVDSNNSVLGTVLPLTAVNEAWNEYTGYAELPDTTNPDVPPAAYIEYHLLLPSNIDIYLTSFQLVVQDLPIRPAFQQDSINRQIDYTYNNAYPIVPVGAIIDFGGFTIPQHYYLCDGSTKDRVRNYLLFNALTTTETVTLTSTVNTFTVVSNANYHIGMAIEGTGIPTSTTISNISGTTITMSANATVTGSSMVTFFAWGNGDGSTTFNLPNLEGFTTAGANGSLLSGTNGIGLSGGSATHTLAQAELPNVNLNIRNGIIPTYAPFSGGGNNGSIAAGDNSTNHGSVALQTAAVSLGGSGTPFNIISPTVLVKKCIRYQ